MKNSKFIVDRIWKKNKDRPIASRIRNAGVIVAWSLCVAGAPLSVFADQTIALRSGNGPVPGSDSAIHMLLGPPNSAFFSTAFTAANFTSARSGPAAFIINNHPAWKPTLTSDPLARWISTRADGASEGGTALYAIDFTITDPIITSATLDFRFLVDNELGDTLKQGLFINGSPLIPSKRLGVVATYFQVDQSFPTFNITSLVHPGVNTLYINSVDRGGPAGLQFTAVIGVKGISNQPPVCNAGGPYSAGCAGATTSVALNGSASSDPDGDVLSYAWTSNCPAASFGNVASGTPSLSLATSPGCNVACNVSLTVSDGKGGTSTCGAAVTISDSIGPVFSGVPNAATAECNALPPTPGVTANDACSGSTAVTSSESIATGSCPGTFVLTRTWSATDGCGNSTSTSQDVSVMDTIDPILVGVPADVSAECDAVPVPATVTSSDTCDTNVPVTFAETQTSGSCPDEYTLTRSWTAVDDCLNDVTALQYVSVDDTVKPVLVCPAGATLECPADTSIAANGSASATDNCATPLVSSSDAVAAGCGTTQTITRTWSASDDCGNSSSCDQTISVVDTTEPAVSVDTTPIHVVDTDCSGGEAVALPSGTANDACDGAVAVTNDAPATFPAGGPTTVTYSASDDCGNSSTDSLDVTVDYGANIAISANKHTVGGGTYPGSTKTPLVGIIVCAYSKADGSCSRTVCGGISHQHYACIVASCVATNCCTTDSTGACTINLPPGDYIVASDDATKTTLPDPLGVSASDLLCGEVKQKHLQQIVKANGKVVPGKTTVRTGSQLLIIEPEFVLWDNTEQLYPFVFDSLGDWGVTATVAPPDGFVADHDALAAQVASTIAAVQFTITEVGSDLVPTETTFEVTHKGKRELIRSQVGIFLTSEYARGRGFNIAQLQASGLIKERPDNQGQGNERKPR